MASENIKLIQDYNKNDQRADIFDKKYPYHGRTNATKFFGGERGCSLRQLSGYFCRADNPSGVNTNKQGDDNNKK